MNNTTTPQLPSESVTAYARQAVGITLRLRTLFALMSRSVFLFVAGALLAGAHIAGAYEFPPAVKWDTTVVQFSSSGSDSLGNFQEYMRDETYVDEENNPQGGLWWVRIYEGAPGFVQYGASFAGSAGPSGTAYYDFDQGDFSDTSPITLTAVETDGSPWEPM